MKLFSMLIILASLVLQGEEFPAKAIIHPIQKTTLSAKISSTIQKIYFEKGQSFKKGDILVELDSTELELLLKTVLIDIQAKETELEFAQRKLSENRQLFKEGTVGELEVRKSEFEVKIKSIALKAAQQQATLNRLKIDQCKITAPYNGKVVENLLEKEELVHTGEKLITVIDDSVALVKIHLPSSKTNRLKAGIRLDVKISETGKVYSAVLSKIAAEITPASRTVEVYAEIPNKTGELKSGMSGVLVKLHD